ncbi:MAG TPA: PTS sugar transporter subunit IIA [Candidatus Coatesbacteria bacterium]|nr:PTS sugar transporter subunit IIA [Candidatus Coatesbacteria bacterium]
MNLSDAIEKKAVLLDLEAGDKDGLLETLTLAVCRSSRVKDSVAAREAILEREGLSPTGMGYGVAMPHARVKSVTSPVLGFASLADGVEYGSVDGEPVRLVFLLLTPSSHPELNVHLLGRLSRICQREENRRRLLGFEKPGDFLAFLREMDELNGAPG